MKVKEYSMNQTNSALPWYRHQTKYNLLITIIIVFIHYYTAPLLSYIDYFDLVCDTAIALLIFILTYIISKIIQPQFIIGIAVSGFSILYLSLLVDAMDEIYIHPKIVKNVMENFLQVIAYLTITYGAYIWLGHNKRIQNKLRRLSTIDPLTGLFNRRAFRTKLYVEFKRSIRYKKDLSLILIDIDFFKKINDKYGHDTGDYVLRDLSLNFSRHLRENDILCRWGGEEFVLFMPESNQQSSKVVAEKIRKFVELHPIKLKNGVNIELTISLGCTSLCKEDRSIDTLIVRADKAMYLSKQNGRNKVTLL